MKAIVIDQYGSPDVLRYQDIPTPTIKPDQVLVKIHASSINPVDWKIRQGLLQPLSGYNFPKVLGCDLSGEVVEVGEKATNWQVGDQVYTFVNPLFGGAYAEYVAVSATNLSYKPQNMTYTEAAGVPVAGLTALQGLLDLGQLRPGQRVLINGASGGVGTFAVQIAAAMNAEVTGVCGTANVEIVKRLGAHTIIDYTQEDFTQQEIQYDIIFDAVGKQSFFNCEKVLKPDGIYISTLPTVDNMGATLQTLFFSNQKCKLVLAQPSRRDLDALRDLIETGKVKTIIDRTYSLIDLAEAHTYSEMGRTVGKIVITVNEGLQTINID
ncbi:NAD(P)-dependent alcohol dehydrogenase [Planktothrix mougeotii]|uniref:NAD(P)-dependent alcohol dehydrogenase n=1 Tax=Planktothrix mougeotii LEGE 06226 TaxID=1828728 RepID=A0ABR9U972_9CYAN|nr:NAD(P)-dependent alcohol dehydrogenase [Planktothrix mougeotii]MBE9142684.1 NAD(P)-dependent alcohol dehydrogenase [Planktothrix mougeotii LEGE 06226]